MLQLSGHNLVMTDVDGTRKGWMDMDAVHTRQTTDVHQCLVCIDFRSGFEIDIICHAGHVFYTLQARKGEMAIGLCSKWHPIPFIAYGPWPKEVHYVGNRVSFEM